MIHPKTSINLPNNIRKEFEISISQVQPISGLSVVIPIRGKDRQSNLNYCVHRLLLQNTDPIEIVISEEDQVERIDLKNFLNDSRVRKVFTQSGPTPFNKSIAINAGVAVSSYNKILMNDTDILVPKGYFKRIDLVLNDYDMCFFGKEIYNVNLLKTGIVWNGSKRTDYFSGGSIAFTKSSFANIGGMCEKFYGYGSEDCEFWERARKLTKLLEVRDTAFVHLNHKRLQTYSVNGDLYSSIVAMPMEERVAMLKEAYKKRTGWAY